MRPKLPALAPALSDLALPAACLRAACTSASRASAARASTSRARLSALLSSVVSLITLSTGLPRKRETLGCYRLGAREGSGV